MKAISLWQPWASLIACGAKIYETRSWAPPLALIGKPIAIHAAKKVDAGAAEFAEELLFGQYVGGGFSLADRLFKTFEGCVDERMTKFGAASMPVGVVVAIARLEAAFQLGELAEGTAVPAARIVRSMTSRPFPSCFSVRLDGFGDYAPGRWAWLLADVRPLNPPPPAKGAKRFFDLPQGWLTEGV